MPMRLWKHPSNYFGATWEDYYVFLGRSRDSSELEESNFEVGLERLGGESADDDEDNIPGKSFHQVIVVHESHWAVGWIEWIAIHKDTRDVYQSPRSKGCVIYTSIIDMANEILDYLFYEYPILDEQHLSDLEYENLVEYLFSRFSGDEDEKQKKLEMYFSEVSENRYLTVDDSDEDLIDLIEDMEEEDGYV